MCVHQLNKQTNKQPKIPTLSQADLSRLGYNPAEPRRNQPKEIRSNQIRSKRN